MITTTNNLTIVTPEGVEFNVALACPVSRCAACSIDFCCVLVGFNLVTLAIRPLAFISQDVSTALTILLYFVISMGYGLLLEWHWDGQTIGKRVMGLRVMDLHGLRLAFHQVAVRNFLRFVDSLPVFYMAGGVISLLSRRHQRLGDYAAQTVVVRIARGGTPDLKGILPDKYNSFKNYPHLAARLRSKIGPDETALIVSALRRRDSLSPQARVEIYASIVKELQRVASFPDEATHSISDERYLRNVVDILYGRPTAEQQTG